MTDGRRLNPADEQRSRRDWRENVKFIASVVNSLAIPLLTVAATAVGIYATNTLKEREIEIATENNAQALRNQREESETNLRCQLMLDVSESMRYGKKDWTKYDCACTIAACLGYLVLRQHDAAGLVTFDSDVRQVVPARSSQTHIDSLVRAMHTGKPQQKTDLEKICRRVAEVMARGDLHQLGAEVLDDSAWRFAGANTSGD